MSSRDMRTQLFGQSHSRSHARPSTPARSLLPYDPDPTVSAAHAQLQLLSLESQNNDHLSLIDSKVAQLKSMGEKMGVEINRLLHLNESISNSFDTGLVKLQNTFRSMVRMSEKAGISIKMWLTLFLVVAICFFFVWIS